MQTRIQIFSGSSHEQVQREINTFLRSPGVIFKDIKIQEQYDYREESGFITIVLVYEV